MDHARFISNKMLPIVYSHIDILSRSFHEGEELSHQVESFVANGNPVHPAVHNREAEINYLRFLSSFVFQIVTARKNFDTKILTNLLKEILSCSVLLPLTDVISDPATINLLVILATDPNVKLACPKSSGKKVVLLENFAKQFQMSIYDVELVSDEQRMDRNFFRDQEKLYTFMQHLKSKSSADIDLLKFYLDVEHLNAELEKPNVIGDPVALSLLQQKSEKLLKFYQFQLFLEYNEATRPDDLLKAHAQARKILQEKWRNDFYKSAEYFQLIYGDRESSSYPQGASNYDVTDNAFENQKVALKLKNVIRTGNVVEGLEATEIPVWDALDHPLGSSSYYSSMTVKLRKERGQDLDNFMLAFFQSIEQDTDVGEDIAFTQTQEEKFKTRLGVKLNHGKSEVFKNLFNIPSAANQPQYSSVPVIDSAVDSAIYFLSSILNINKIILRLLKGLVSLLPDADNIVSQLLTRFLEKLLSQEVLAKLINELEEKIFEDPTNPPTQDEQKKRFELATSRLASVNKHSVKILSFLQNPVLNKHLAYCLLDTIAIELFPEFSKEDF